MPSKTEILCLIMDYLYSENLFNSLVTLETESSVSIFNYKNQLSFLRKLILEGKWDDTENYFNPLKSYPNFDYNKAMFILLKQKFLEGIEGDNGLESSDLENQLTILKNYSSDEDFQKILSLLNQNSIKDNAEYKNWTPFGGRLICFEKIREILKNIFPINESSERKIPKDILKNTLIKICGEDKFNQGEIIKTLKEFIDNKNLVIENKLNFSNTTNHNVNSFLDDPTSLMENFNKNYNSSLTNNSNISKRPMTTNPSSRIPHINNPKVNKSNSQSKGNKPKKEIINASKTNTNQIKKDIKEQPKKENVLEPSYLSAITSFCPENSYSKYTYDPSSYESETLLVDSQPIRTCCFNPNGEYLVLGTNSKALKFYNFSPIIKKFINKESNKKLVSLPLLYEQLNFHLGSIYCLDWSSSGKLVASGSNDKIIKILVVPDLKKIESDLEDPENMYSRTKKVDPLIMELTGHKGTIRSLFFDPFNEHNLISGGSLDNNVFVWNCERGELTYSLSGHENEINCLKHSNRTNFNIFGSADKNKLINFWDLRSRNKVNYLKIENYADINDISFTPNFIATAHKNGIVSLWDYKSSKLLKEIKCNEDGSEVRSINFSKDEKYLISGGFDKKIKIYDVLNNFNICKTMEHTDKVVCNIWHPEIPSIVSSSTDKTAKIWLPKIY